MCSHHDEIGARPFCGIDDGAMRCAFPQKRAHFHPALAEAGGQVGELCSRCPALLLEELHRTDGCAVYMPHFHELRALEGEQHGYRCAKRLSQGDGIVECTQSFIGEIGGYENALELHDVPSWWRAVLPPSSRCHVSTSRDAISLPTVGTATPAGKAAP